MVKHYILAILIFCAFTVNAQDSTPTNLSISEKVYGLSKFWEEVNYNFIYLNRVDRKMWDSSYKSMIGQVIKTSNDYEYYRLLQKFCALLKDGHTNISFPPTFQNIMFNSMFGSYRIGLKNVNNKAIVSWTNYSKRNEVPVGSEIIEINNLPTELFIKDSVSPYISASTDYIIKDESIRNLFLGLEGTSYKLKIKKPSGQTFILNLTHSKTTEIEIYPKIENKPLLDFKWYENKIAYVSLNSFEDQKIDTLFKNILPQLYQARGLVIDLRYNGGGSTNIGEQIIQYLTNGNVLQHSRNFTREHIASFKAWGEGLVPADTINNSWNSKCFIYNHDMGIYPFDYSPDTINLKEKRIVIPTTLLIGHGTASAAEDFLIMADNQKHIIKIGERSYGSTGQPFAFDMPSGGIARICTKKDTYPNGKEFVGIGVIPDISVIPSVEDLINRTDPVILKAIEVLNNKSYSLGTLKVNLKEN